MRDKAVDPHYAGSVRHPEREPALPASTSGAESPAKGESDDGRRVASARCEEENALPLTNHEPEVIAIVESSGVLRYVSPSVGQLLGYLPEDLTGERPDRLVHADDLTAIQGAFAALRQTPGGSLQECRIRGKDGNYLPLNLSFTNAIDRGAVAGILVIARDATALKRLEKQSLQVQKMEALGRLVESVAHDFNNLLTTIMGCTGFISLDLAPDSPLRPEIEEIERAADRGAALVRQLTAYGRRDASPPQTLHLESAIANVEEMLHRLIGENIQLSILHGDHVGGIRADPTQIEQVIVNLCINARDAMPGGGWLVIETANVDLGGPESWRKMSVSGPCVMLAVSDNGVGMDQTVKERLFEPFFSTKAPGKGTGLGLATVHRIVKESGGSIHVYSELGRGTTFKIYFPRVDGPKQEEQEQPTHDLVRGSETILLVEDDDIVRQWVRRSLEGQGYTVIEAARPDEALRLALEHHTPLDLLVTDMVMPGANGRELADLVAVWHPEIKVLYISGYTGRVTVHHGLLESDVHFLPKPFSVQVLAKKVREVLTTT